MGLSQPRTARFWLSKSYFRHFYNSLLSFDFLIHTIHKLILQLTIYALTLSLNTDPWKASTTRRFAKYAWTSYAVEHLGELYSLWDFQIYPLLSEFGSFQWQFFQPTILITVLLLFQRTFCIFVPCSNAGHTTENLTAPCFQWWFRNNLILWNNLLSLLVAWQERRG